MPNILQKFNAKQKKGLYEKLATIEHERWADWQKWCHKKILEALGTNNLPSQFFELIQRWERQIRTPYKKLTKKEKDSDREQVDRYWKLIEKNNEELLVVIEKVFRETAKDYSLDHPGFVKGKKIMCLNPNQFWAVVKSGLVKPILEKINKLPD